jgi:hypothetical protein
MQYCSVQYITVKYKYSVNVQTGQMDLNCSLKKKLPHVAQENTKGLYTHCPAVRACRFFSARSLA